MGGERHRDADRMLTAIAQRWHPGDRMQLLQLPDSSDDSVILATS